MKEELDEPYGLFHLPFNRRPGEPAGVAPRTEWLNMGFWKDADNFPDAAEALALKVIHAAQPRRGSHVLGAIFHNLWCLTNEITAIVPLHDTSTQRPESWIKARLRTWVNEGEVWAARVGSRYGIFGYEKRPPGTPFSKDIVISHKLAGDAANAVVAYAITKALLPVRIGLSLYLAPGFSRGAIEPVRMLLVRLFRRNL